MVSNEMTVAQLVEMGIKLETLQSFVTKEMKKSQRQIVKAERESQKAEISIKVLEVLNSDPSKGWKTGLLVKEIFGLTRTDDSKMEDERHKAHSLISSSLKDLVLAGSIVKRQLGANACHTWYQSTIEVAEAEFGVNSQDEEVEVELTKELMYQVIDDLEESIQDEEDFQASIKEALKE